MPHSPPQTPSDSPSSEQPALALCQRLAALPNHAQSAPRLLTILAHPDDECIAFGGRLRWLRTSQFLGVTDGVPPDGKDAASKGFATLQAYAATRQQELAAVVQHVGVPPSASVPLLVNGRSLPDQAACRNLVPLTRALQWQIEHFRPDAVLTHPYEGGHPDHDACAFAAACALQLAALDIPLLEAPFYYLGPHGFTTGAFLNGPAGITATLSPAQSHEKQILLALFHSQRETLQPFGTTTEQYRPAPAYDFTQPPHAGTLNYESWGWNISGQDFCAYATDALRELGL